MKHAGRYSTARRKMIFVYLKRLAVQLEEASEETNKQTNKQSL
jgi:hypothetical protein